jgi:hypothetical protein
MAIKLVDYLDQLATNTKALADFISDPPRAMTATKLTVASLLFSPPCRQMTYGRMTMSRASYDAI